MRFFSFERILILIRMRLKVCLLGGSVCAFGSLFLGLMTPYLYHSEALVQLPIVSKPSDGILTDDNAELYRYANLMRSPKLLGEVASDIVKERPFVLEFVAPRSISIFDIKQRSQLLTASLRRLPASAIRHDKESPPDSGTLASLMAPQLAVDPDPVMHTLRVTYEAGTSELSQTICAQIIERFINFTTSMELQELQRQEHYLENAIQQQLADVAETEKQMRSILEKFPQITVSKNDQKGAALIAEKYLEKREALRTLEDELQSNDRVLAKIRTDLFSHQDYNKKVTGDVTSKVIEEISELEFKRLQYTRVSGYPEDHPQVQAIDKRIEILKQVLNQRDGDANRNTTSDAPALSDSVTGMPNFKSLYQQGSLIAEKNRSLDARREALAKDLEAEDTLFKQVVKVNFSFDSLQRELTTNTSIITELYRDLQKTRLSMAGMAAPASILSPPTQPLYSSNLSVRKRTFFGFFVGLAAVLSILILAECLHPILLASSDFKQLAVRSFGVFPLQEHNLSQVASILFSFRNEAPAPAMGKVIACYPFNLPYHFEKYVIEAARLLTTYGARVGLITVRDDLGIAPKINSRIEGFETIVLKREALPAFFASAAEELRSKLDFVLVIAPTDSRMSSELFVARKADYFVYFTQVGVSDLASIERLRSCTPEAAGLQHCAMVYG